jgi:hypothetical protein
VTRNTAGPLTLGRMGFLYTAVVLLVVLPVICALAFFPVVENYWCAWFEIPQYEQKFGFKWGSLESADANHTVYGITSVQPDGAFAKAGIRAGDVPRMQHGVSSVCAALAAASQGHEASLSVLNVNDWRAGRSERREIPIESPAK